MNFSIRPRVGETWSFGSGGRPDVIKEISRGARGEWKLVGGKFTKAGRQTCMWIKWKSGMNTISVKSLWKDWLRQKEAK